MAFSEEIILGVRSAFGVEIVPGVRRACIDRPDRPRWRKHEWIHGCSLGGSLTADE
jgi:hypothetical protein